MLPIDKQFLYLHFLKVLQLGDLIIEEEELAVLRLQIQLQVQAGTWYVSMMQFYKVISS